jgi:hypothetical protein
MSWNYQQQKEDNARAMADPRPGDYWHETFCPYFIVVDRRGPDITVLSCLGGPKSRNRKNEPNAWVEVDSEHWSWDLSQSMTVDLDWIRRAVCYESIDGFVADVVNSERQQAVVSEWRDHYQRHLLQQIDRLQTQWEQFTGWQALKKETA